MRRLLFATNNQHKLREVREIIGDRFQVISLAEAGFSGEIPETEATLDGNAHQKARYIYERTKMDCFADDTGLEIEALDGRPGVYSARYAGEDCSFDDNINKVLEEMGNTDNRKAAFRCVICLILGGKEFIFEGRTDGMIARERHGAGGFGYDPVFIPIDHDQSFAEMDSETKNRISHRGRAMSKLVKFLSHA
jgi:XTP/dITP diphosphohydrolase